MGRIVGGVWNAGRTHLHTYTIYIRTECAHDQPEREPQHNSFNYFAQPMCVFMCLRYLWLNNLSSSHCCQVHRNIHDEPYRVYLIHTPVHALYFNECICSRFHSHTHFGAERSLAPISMWAHFAKRASDGHVYAQFVWIVNTRFTIALNQTI